MKRSIRRLERRKDWLQSQVDSTRSDLSYTKAELSALRQAIACMEFVENGFYDILTDRSANLTVKQIIRLEGLKVKIIKDEVNRQYNNNVGTNE